MLLFSRFLTGALNFTFMIKQMFNFCFSSKKAGWELAS